MVPDVARAILAEGCAILRGLGITHWLSAGTCLGLVRDGLSDEFLRRDTDLDIDVLGGSDEAAKIRAAFLAAGWQVSRAYDLPRGRAAHLGLVKDGVLTDFIFQRLEEGWVLAETECGRLRHLARPLASVQGFPVPSPPEEYLAERYGDRWRQPEAKRPWMDVTFSLERPPERDCGDGEFSHSGDLGDIIYALPAIRHACETTRTGRRRAKLWLYHHAGRTREAMTPERAASIIPLLEAQPYISEVHFSPSPVHSNLNGFRDHWRRATLAAAHLGTMGYNDDTLLDRAWLEVAPVRIAQVIVHRSPRYHTAHFPWRELLRLLGDYAVCVGSTDEHAALCQLAGREIPHHPTSDLLDLARVIAGADLFIGNQSSPFAIAEGLKRPAILEADGRHDNCHRPRRWLAAHYDHRPLAFADVCRLLPF